MENHILPFMPGATWKSAVLDLRSEEDIDGLNMLSARWRETRQSLLRINTVRLIGWWQSQEAQSMRKKTRRW